MNTEELRRRVEERSSRPVGDRMWAFLERDGYIGDALIEEENSPGTGVDYLARRIRDVRKALEDPPSQSERAPDMKGRQSGDVVQRAVSITLARYANLEPDVIAFRQEILDGDLLDPNDVESWISREVEVQGEPTKWVSIPVPSNQANDIWSYKIPPDVGKIKFDYERLSYGVPGDDWERTVDVRFDGILGYLSKLSTNLSKRYPWRDAQSTVFILTGHVPTVEPASARIHRQFDFPESAWRIVLTVDPTVQPATVRDIYGRVRRHALEGRYRPLSEKHLELAIFAAEKSEDQTWAERMKEWNATSGGKIVETTGVSWAYSDVDRFTRECQRALRRVMFPVSRTGNLTPSPGPFEGLWRLQLQQARSKRADSDDGSRS